MSKLDEIDAEYIRNATRSGRTNMSLADMSLLIRAVRQWHDRAVYLEPKYLDNIPVPHMDNDVEGLFDEPKEHA